MDERPNMNTIIVKGSALSLKLPDTVLEFPFCTHCLEDMLNFSETFLQNQLSLKNQTCEDVEKPFRYLSELSTEIKKTNTVIDVDYFCEALNTIAFGMTQCISTAYELHKNERLCMEFLKDSASNLRAGKVGDLYFLSSTENSDGSTSYSIALSDSLRKTLLSMYEADPNASTEDKISFVINLALKDYLQDRLHEEHKMNQSYID